jgi:hypothetical protein
MAYNLARNSRVFVTTNLDSYGAVAASGFTTANTFEVQVLDGFSFSQGTNQTTISINEAGETPIRGQRAFNTALNPVEISFSTYIRPRLNGSQATAEERVLWNALMGSVPLDYTGTTAPAIGGTVAGITRASTLTNVATITGTSMTYAGISVGDIGTLKGLAGTGSDYWNQQVKVTALSGTSILVTYLSAPPTAAGTSFSNAGSVRFDKAAWVEKASLAGNAISYGQVTSATSNKNKLQSLGFIFIVDGATYTIDNCAIDGASIDFGLDAISMVAWTAKGTKLNQLATTVSLSAATDPVMSGGLTGTATGKVTTANYITNKLSTVSLKSGIGETAGTDYTIVLTGGNIQIANNINYITPNNIGVVNIPIGYYTGARAVSGTLNAYLRTGSGFAADLLTSMLSDVATASETKFNLSVDIGGSSNTTRVELNMPGVSLGIPSVEVADVVSTAITFNAQSTTGDKTTSGNTYDIENTNDIEIRYYSV